LRIVWFAVSLMLLLAGCMQQSSPQTKAKSAAQDPMCKPVPIRYFHLEEQAKAIGQQVNGVDRAVAVRIDDELDVALVITNFNRFRFQAIEKEVSKKLKEAFPRTKIHVSSDQKLIEELQRMSEQPWSNKPEEACRQKEKLKELEKKMRG